MSQHDNDNAHGGNLEWQQPGSLPRLSGNAQGAIIGKAVATNIPEATEKEEKERTESVLSKRLEGKKTGPAAKSNVQPLGL